jgi:putative SOS response-associated peptidase YedK
VAIRQLFKTEVSLMCNLYLITKGPQAIRDIARAMRGDVGNMPPLPGVFPDYSAPVVRNTPEGRELAMVRWGMSLPVFALKGRDSDSGVTNVRNTASSHWRRWLGIEGSARQTGIEDGKRIGRLVNYPD